MPQTKHKKKILYLITKSAPFGGAQRYVYDLATAFADTYDVVVALGVPADGPAPLKETLEDAGIRTVAIPDLEREIRIGKEVRVFRFLLSLLRDERPDILHVNSAKVGGLGALAGRLRGIARIVFTAHGWEFNNPARSRFAREMFRVLSWLTILLSHITIAVSAAMRDDMRWMPFTRNKMTVVYHGIPPSTPMSQHAAREALARYDTRLSQRLNAHWVGILAELHPVKGIDVAITAIHSLVERYPDIQLVVCGEGEMREELETVIREKEIANNVALLGFVPDAREYVSAFDIFLFPSYAEAFGYAPLEAGAAGVPVIASRVGALPEIITDGETGRLVPPGDADALAAAVHTLLADSARRRAYASTLSNTVRTTFSRERMLEHTAAVYTNN